MVLLLPIFHYNQVRWAFPAAIVQWDAHLWLITIRVHVPLQAAQQSTFLITHGWRGIIVPMHTYLTLLCSGISDSHHGAQLEQKHIVGKNSAGEVASAQAKNRCRYFRLRYCIEKEREGETMTRGQRGEGVRIRGSWLICWPRWGDWDNGLMDLCQTGGGESSWERWTKREENCVDCTVCVCVREHQWCGLHEIGKFKVQNIGAQATQAEYDFAFGLPIAVENAKHRQVSVAVWRRVQMTCNQKLETVTQT